MTPVLLATVLGAGLLTSALLSPWVVRQAAPALVRVPRLAVGLLSLVVGVWVATALAVGPLLAWVISGPVVLPGQAAEVCQRCLAAANPFGASPVDTAVPAVVLIVVSAAAMVLLMGGVARDLLQRARRSRRSAQWVLADAERRTLHGHQVSVVDSEHLFAVAFPAAHGGIAVSTAALRALGDDELIAVLAHECAHLRQRHHLVSEAMASVARHLRWVPLVAPVAQALPHYLEIAADQQASRRAGTVALVKALVTLGERSGTTAAPQGPPLAGVLHAAGPERIRQLVHPVRGAAGAVPAVAMTAHLVVLALVSAAVYLPYALAALRGCL